MFGGHVTTPNTSPHLRKSGSRPVLFDIGRSELGNSAEEDLLRSFEPIEMKVGAMPLSSVAIMPSPVLLWRLKVLLFVIWGFSCCKIGWDSVMRMSADVQDLFLYEAFLYYNPLLLVTMMVWLWGINLWVFAQSNIGYARIFDLDSSHLNHKEIWKVLLYAAVALILIFPFDIFYLSSRYFLLRTIWRIMFPLQAISFADFFLADIFTSMSKIRKSVDDSHQEFDRRVVPLAEPFPQEHPTVDSLMEFTAESSSHNLSAAKLQRNAKKNPLPFRVFSDLERSVCRMVHRQVATIAWFEADSVCGSHSVTIPVVLVLPYIFRFFQCLRQYKDTREKTSLLNALKYSTAVPVIFLSALKYHVFPNQWTSIYRPLWLLSSLLNSSYSFYWDVTRDWDLSCFTRIFKFSRPHLLSHLMYGRKWVYIWVIGSNLVLRCTWTYKLSAHLRHNYITVFTITALEMFRRFQWVFFRVENEWNKMNTKSNIQLSTIDMPTEEQKLLGTNGHEV